MGSSVAEVGQTGGGTADLHVELANGYGLPDLVKSTAAGKDREGIGKGGSCREAARPAAVEVMSASAMPISKYRWGYLS